MGQRGLFIDDNLIAIMNDRKNSLEICRLEIDPPGPHLKTVCNFELLPLTSGSNVCSRDAFKEWVPTLKDYARYRSSRGYHSPFYSSTIRTFGLVLDYLINSVHQPSHKRTMVISIAAVISAIPADVRIVPWVDWGPSCTHIFEASSVKPAGPLWITSTSPLVVRQYNLRYGRYYTRSIAEVMSSQTRSQVFSSTEVGGDFWDGYSIETNLPYRDVIANILNFRHIPHIILADREWIVGIAKHSVRGLFYISCVQFNRSNRCLIASGRMRELL